MGSTTIAATERARSTWPVFAADEIEASIAVLQSGRVNYWTGQEGRLFEREFADYVGTRHAVLLANGSVAIEAALMALGIGPGDDVIVTPRSFFASASSPVLVGARSVFADVDRESGNLTAETIAAALTPTARAVVLVHLAGWPCEMTPILDLAAERGIAVIEDCAQAHGATYRGRRVGSIGTVNTWSFCQDKIMTTGGEGGMITTDDEGLWSDIWSRKDHGKSYEAVYHRAHRPGFRWLHESFGTNWRMTEPQAAIGRVQLRKLDDWVARRNQNAAVFRARLGDLDVLRMPTPPAHLGHAMYKLYAYVRPEALRDGWSRDRIVAALAEHGVPALSGSCSEIYREKAFVDAGLGPDRSLPVARELGETSLMFLVHPTMEEAEIHEFCDVYEGVLREATR